LECILLPATFNDEMRYYPPWQYGRLLMSHYHARVDTSRHFKKSGKVREIPVLVNGKKALALFDEEAFEALSDMVSTIQTKIPDYTYMSAVERATKRALEDGLFSNGVVIITPAHV
jgi:hypothetical protein